MILCLGLRFIFIDGMFWYTHKKLAAKADV